MPSGSLAPRSLISKFVWLVLDVLIVWLISVLVFKFKLVLLFFKVILLLEFSVALVVVASLFVVPVHEGSVVVSPSGVVVLAVAPLLSVRALILFLPHRLAILVSAEVYIRMALSLSLLRISYRRGLRLFGQPGVVVLILFRHFLRVV